MTGLLIFLWGFAACVFTGYRFHKYPRERILAGGIFFIYGVGLVMMLTVLFLRAIS